MQEINISVKNQNFVHKGWKYYIKFNLSQRKKLLFIIADATLIRIRKNGGVRQRDILIAIAVNEEGYREVLGIMLGDSKPEESWDEFFFIIKAKELTQSWYSSSKSS